MADPNVIDFEVIDDASAAAMRAIGALFRSARKMLVAGHPRRGVLAIDKSRSRTAAAATPWVVRAYNVSTDSA
jgi:hypothetical protein